MKNNKGIVLIALLVMIVIIIIIVKVSLQETSENEIIENADKANTSTESSAILEFFIAAQGKDENLESDILETAQNFVKNNEISDVKYTLIPDPFEKSYLYENVNEKIIIVEGQAGYYKFKITKQNVSYEGQAGKEELEIYNY